jgi:RNAse (barnase) inhibitor barstar
MKELKIKLVKSPSLTELDHNQYFIGVLNGERSKSIKAFLHEIGALFNFPGYYGENMNAFYDCINDLSWIDQRNYALVIKNYSQFLANEPDNTTTEYLSIFDRISKEWANVPNYYGEEKFRAKANFKVFIVEDEKAIRDFKLLQSSS